MLTGKRAITALFCYLRSEILTIDLESALMKPIPPSTEAHPAKTGRSESSEHDRAPDLYCPNGWADTRGAQEIR